MSDHLPECLNDDDTYGWRRWCICEELRACEQRVRQSAATLWDRTSEQMAAARVEGIRAGLDAAREAVDALPTEQTVKEGVSEFWVEINHAIAAIDALRQKP